MLFMNYKYGAAVYIYIYWWMVCKRGVSSTTRVMCGYNYKKVVGYSWYEVSVYSIYMWFKWVVTEEGMM